MSAYYNDNDPKVAAWLRELIARGLVEDGSVDERSIREVRPGDCAERSHFFAGIGGWPYALALAGWPADAPVWTGSCPCQPLSAAGRRGRHEDARHLWPEFFRLIAECRPATVFGEQVASRDGRAWFAAVRADLETLGYAVGAAVLPAAGVGAVHARHRVFWAADSRGEGGPGLVPCADSRVARPGRVCGPEDLRAIVNAPFERGDRWPQPLVRAVDDGVPERVALLAGAGNAIVPQVAATFVRAFMEATLLRRARP